MIYVCSVYTPMQKGLSERSKDEIKAARYQYAMKRTAKFLKRGEIVFSPIAHCHEMSYQYGLPHTWDFWRELDFGYLAACDKVYVLTMPDWEKSVGVAAEIAEAKRLGKKVYYFPCPDYTDPAVGLREVIADCLASSDSLCLDNPKERNILTHKLYSMLDPSAKGVF